MTTSMGFAEGFLGIQARAARGRAPKHLDWIKAARIILDNQPVSAVAGLDGDFACTSATIYENGSPVLIEGDCYYGTSNWAIPTIVLHLFDGSTREIPCYATGNADAHVWWPEDALAVLSSAKKGGTR